MKSFGKTDIGRKRSVNQDYVYFSDTPIGRLPNLYVVADGMGGHKAGDYASQFAVLGFQEYVKAFNNSNPITLIREAIRLVNEGIMEQAQEKIELRGMGTTFVCAVIMDSTMYVANIGDSRLYVLQEGAMKQITLDHSLVEELIRTGKLERNKVRNHPEKNIITKALGVENDVEPDFFEVNLQSGAKILLCSDGLTNMVENEEIYEIIQEYDKDIETAVDVLIERANYYGGTDNIAAVIVDCM